MREARRRETPCWRSTTAPLGSPGKASGAHWAEHRPEAPEGLPQHTPDRQTPLLQFLPHPRGQTFLRAAGRQPSPAGARGGGTGHSGVQGLRLGGHGGTRAGARRTRCRVSPWGEKKEGEAFWGASLHPGTEAGGTQWQETTSSSHTVPRCQPCAKASRPPVPAAGQRAKPLSHCQPSPHRYHPVYTGPSPPAPPWHSTVTPNTASPPLRLHPSHTAVMAWSSERLPHTVTPLKPHAVPRLPVPALCQPVPAPQHAHVTPTDLCHHPLPPKHPPTPQSAPLCPSNHLHPLPRFACARPGPRPSPTGSASPPPPADPRGVPLSPSPQQPHVRGGPGTRVGWAQGKGVGVGGCRPHGSHAAAAPVTHRGCGDRKNPLGASSRPGPPLSSLPASLPPAPTPSFHGPSRPPQPTSGSHRAPFPTPLAAPGR